MNAANVSDDEILEIATEGYLYAYPLVLMDVSRRVMTNCDVPEPSRARAPLNEFCHIPMFPDATFTDVVRANTDTLYSTMWFDVGREPLIIDLPDSGGRYYLLPMLDLWTDVFASPGSRTTGTGPQTYALTGPGWKGTLPDGVSEIEAPTATGWIIGRTQTNGKADYDAVHVFQAGVTATPLSAWGGKGVAAARAAKNPAQDESAPVEQVQRMTAADFFARFADLTGANPPHAHDFPVLQRLARIGIVPGRAVDFARIPPAARAAIEAAREAAAQKVLAGMHRVGTPVNGWRNILTPVGTYGTDYLRRALIAYGGVGANVIEDAIYPTALADAEGKPFDSAARYAVHFAKEQIPPVRAFWSLTMYNDRQFLADNPIDRYAIGDRDPLIFNADGSLDLYIQRESPGGDKERNWLPAPKTGGFSMNLRLYWPRPAALDGGWTPPPVRRLN